MSVLVVDIETVADVPPWVAEAWKDRAEAPANYKDPVKIERYKEEQVQRRLEKAALSPLTGRVVAVGLGWRDEPEWEFSAFIDRQSDEETLLRAVDAAIAGLPRVGWIVSYNGRRFDFPFLAVRAMKHRLELKHKWPLGKWDRRHVDMYDAFGEGGLADWGRLLLGEDKSGHGSHVEELVREARWDEIEAYCLNDVRLTAGLWDLYRSTTAAGGYHGEISSAG